MSFTSGCLLSSECSFIRMKQTTAVSQEKREEISRSFTLTSAIYNALSLNNSTWWLCWSYLSHYTWNKVSVRVEWDRNLTEEIGSFQFSIVNFPFIRSKPAYEVYISQLIIYSRTSVSNQDILDWWLLWTRKLQNQWFLEVNLKPEWRIYPYGMPNTGDQSSKCKFEFLYSSK